MRVASHLNCKFMFLHTPIVKHSDITAELNKSPIICTPSKGTKNITLSEVRILLPYLSKDICYILPCLFCSQILLMVYHILKTEMSSVKTNWKLSLSFMAHTAMTQYVIW